MKILKRKITAVSDYRKFDGYSPDELEELMPELFDAFLKDVRIDVDEFYVSRNPECDVYGILSTSGDYFLWLPNGYRNMGPGWYEVTFQELADALG